MDDEAAAARATDKAGSVGSLAAAEGGAVQLNHWCSPSFNSKPRKRMRPTKRSMRTEDGYRKVLRMRPA
jgi:hypothetical protein